LNAVLGALDARNACSDETVVLETVEMPPRVFLEIVGFAKRFARWTRIQGSTIGLYIKAQLTGSFFKIERLPDYLPWIRETKAKCQQISSTHRLLPPFEGLDLSYSGSCSQ